MAHGFLGWGYVALTAAFRPDSLIVPVSSLLPVRRDTFGSCCFVLSAAAAFALRSHTGRWWTRHQARPGRTDAALWTLAAYALALWVYLCLNSLTHPRTIGMPLTHFAGFPTEGSTASWCFAVSVTAVFAARLRSWRAAADGDDGAATASARDGAQDRNPDSGGAR